MAKGEGLEEEGVFLEPFIHQVGGHFPLVSLDDFTLCKPLNLKELQFYQNLPDSLTPFTPSYKGTMRAFACEDDQGYISIVGTPPPSLEKSILKSKPKIRWQRKGGMRIEISPESYCNPWALKIHQDRIKTLDTSSDYYILLENIVHKHRNPCVLDLKVGPRQYSDDVSPSKKQRKIAKSKESTSGALGLRLCGLQSYNPISDNYYCLNKYYGRSLTPSSFEKTIEDFFLKSGRIFRLDVCLQVIDKCRKLIDVLEGLDSFRFYTSSLLVSYEGRLDTKILSGGKDILTSSSNNSNSSNTPTGGSTSTGNIVDVRMIDFAHSTHKGLKDTVHYEGPDQGFIFGLKNFIDILERISSAYS
eukprot:TRINITY_DN1850_c0_g1_i2.p1 TRINITY_DN1850_c0_g1~~TRINITY_DN1850_c0_g1_i2.p1  ORF type:complete len:359 (-),score=119.27 TRINITY_DN1850_c0_g1_i2:206-1282(-)